jgi:adenine-specific DNA-methyltransferase
MTTDPGDLVLDPTCGSGTTAFVAEQWGRRWITIDTSRIALNISKQRLMTAVFPFYILHDTHGGDIRQGFKYKTVPHITLKSLANNEPPATETLYDQPEQDKKLLRVSGPFTVETLQNFEPISPEDLDDEVRVNEEEGAFEEVIKQHLLSAGIKNGRKDEMVVFRSVELLSHSYLHAEGFYITKSGEQKAYFHIGPKFGTVSKKLVSDAVKECRQKGDANWLVILGFSFESFINSDCIPHLIFFDKPSFINCCSIYYDNDDEIFRQLLDNIDII